MKSYIFQLMGKKKKKLPQNRRRENELIFFAKLSKKIIKNTMPITNSTKYIQEGANIHGHSPLNASMDVGWLRTEQGQ